jgi:phage gp45-like
MMAEFAGELRSAAAFGVVTAVRDAGEEQVVDVQILPGVVRSGVRVLQPFGFASSPVADGAVVMLIQVGGDPANLAALPATRPGRRFGNLAAGETVVYGEAGQRIAMRADGSVEVLSATEVRITCAVHVQITAPTVGVTGDLVVSGDISDQSGLHGTLGALRSDYDVHTHPDPQGGSTGTPSLTTP